MNLNKTTALTLRIGVVIGLILITAGLFLSMTDNGDVLLYFGILILIASPFLGVIASLVCLLKEKDTFWAMVAVILLVITATGAILAI